MTKLSASPAESIYPRAAVGESNKGWFIIISPTAVDAYILREENLPSTPVMTFDARHHAMTHAAREVHALRARRHPAGQHWLRQGSAGGWVKP